MADYEKKEVLAGMEDARPVITTTTTNIVGDAEELHSGTKRALKSRHAQMIAIGGTIGTGLFVGSGQALHMGGPLFILLAYCIISGVVFGVVTATTEMSAYLPVRGCSMAYFGTRFVSESLGFALAWLYFYIFSITVPAEITATSLVINYWHAPIDETAWTAIWITVTMVVIIGLNCFSARVYGEAEFWFASIKIIGILGLLIMALCFVCGGNPSGDAYGFRYWHNPGPVNEYVVGGASGRLAAFVATITFSIFAFAFAPELLVVTGGEMESPRRNLPKAGRRYFYRLIFFYVFGVLAIGCIVASNNPNLLGGGSGAGSSPWAIAIREAGVRGLDSVVNAVIVTSAWSAGNSYLYLSSRTLYSMALVGNAPKIFTKCTKQGIPYNALAASSAFSLLAYLNLSDGGATVFNWFVNLINTGAYLSWICIALIYLRFRKATLEQDVTDLPFQSRFQPYLSYVNIAILSLLMLLSGFAVFLKDNWDTDTFLTAYLGIPIFAVFYGVHKLWRGRHDPLYRDAKDVDLTSGLQAVKALETEEEVKPEKWYLKWKALYS